MRKTDLWSVQQRDQYRCNFPEEAHQLLFRQVLLAKLLQHIESALHCSVILRLQNAEQGRQELGEVVGVVGMRDKRKCLCLWIARVRHDGHASRRRYLR
jgi:hypothetical protein